MTLASSSTSNQPLNNQSMMTTNNPNSSSNQIILKQETSQPPLPYQPAAFSNNSNLRNLNKTYLTGQNLIPRRPTYSTSRVEMSTQLKSHDISRSFKNQEFFENNNLYMKQEQLVNPTPCVSDQTQHKTKSYVKNCSGSIGTFNSGEANPAKVNGPFKASKMKVLKFLQDTSKDNIMNRKSAFQPVASKTKNSDEINEIEHSYSNQQQNMPSTSSGTSSTTSSILSSVTSQCLSNSNSINNSLCMSKSSENMSSKSKSILATPGTRGNVVKPIPESIRSGSVSSARSIYELRLKSLNESNMQALVNSTHSQVGRPSNRVKNNNLTFSPSSNWDIISGKYRRRTHLSDNDYLQAISSRKPKTSAFFNADNLVNTDSSQFSNINKFQDTSKMSNSTKVLHKLLMSPRTNLSNDNQEKYSAIIDAQRRLSYNNYRSHEHQQAKFHDRKSIGVEIVDMDDELMLDDVNVDLDYEDDDIFGEDDEDVKMVGDVLNERDCLNIASDITASSGSASSSSSLMSNPLSSEQKQILQKSKNYDQSSPATCNLKHPFSNFTISASTSSGKSFISTSSSASSMSPPYTKPPQPPKSPCSPEPKTKNIFNFNIPGKEFSVIKPAIMSPKIPPLPSQSTQLTNVSQINFAISSSLQNFSHFDIQSVLFNYDRVKVIKDALQLSINMRTGASAASKQTLNNTEDKFNSMRKVKLAMENQNHKTNRSNINSISSILGSLEQSSSVDEASIAGDIARDDQFVNNNENKHLSNSLFLYLNDEKENLLKRSKCMSTSSLRSQESLNLVEECSFFRLEMGGDVFKGLGLCGDISQRRMMKLNSLSILDKFTCHYKKEFIELIEANTNEPFTVEFQDWGAYFYRFYFMNQEHSNYLGIDPHIGPCAISIKREKLFVDNSRNYSTNTVANHQSTNEKSYEYAYRLIFRTSDLNVLRGTILEEHIIAKHVATSKGLAHKEIINYLFPELDLNCIRLADSKVSEKLQNLDENSVIKTHKIGVLLCKAGQSTEEEMYNNKDSTPAFDEFLELLGDKVLLKGFANYRGGLDINNDTTSTHSVYTKFRDKEIMFHVSTLLPYSTNDKQQLTRKRHIGNDMVTVIFQEPGALPFSPKTIRSHFQHIFIVVRAIPNKTSSTTQYSVAVSYSTDVPSFGPPLPKNPRFIKSKEFRDFLLAKIVNADSAGCKCEKITHIKMRAQQGTLRELALNYSSKVTLANVSTISNSVAQKLSLFNFGSVKQKKTRSKSLQMFNNLMSESEEKLAISLSQLTGCLYWNIEKIEDFQYTLDKNCYFGISKQCVVAVDPTKKSILFSIASNAIIGWTPSDLGNSLILYFDQGECINIKFSTQADVNQVLKRLEYFTRGCRSSELSLEKKDYGQLGFSIHHDGVVTEVEPYSLAYFRGLKQGTRIVKINDYFVVRLNHEKMIDILRRSAWLKVTFLAPLEDGTVRRGQEDSYLQYSYLSTCSLLNERIIDSIGTPLLPRSIASSNRTKNTFHGKPESKASMNTSVNSQKNSGSNSVLNKHLNGLITPKSRKNSENILHLYHSKSSEIDDDPHLKSVSSSDSFNTNKEWNRLVQEASVAHEEAMQKNSMLSADIVSNGQSIKSSRNYISTKEILASNVDALREIKKNFLKHKEETNTSNFIEEIKDAFFQMQIELNQRKQEKQLFDSQFKDMLKENMTLKQKLHKLQDENSKLMYQSVFGSSISASSSREKNSENNMQFVDLNKDSSV